MSTEMLTVWIGTNLKLQHDSVLRSGRAAGVVGFHAGCGLRGCVESGRPAARRAREAEAHAGNVGEFAGEGLPGDVALLQTGDEHFVRDGFGNGVDEAALRLGDSSLHLGLVDD